VAASCCLLALGACALPGSNPTGVQRVAIQRTVTVAVVGVFSGPSAPLGRAVRNSLQVEADDLNARGGVLGSRVEVVAADSEQNPAKAAELVKQQLSDSDVKLLVGPDFTSGYVAVRDSVAQAAMPNCVSNVGGEALTGALFTFRSDAGERSSVANLLGYLHQSHADLKKVGLLDDGEDTAPSVDHQLAEQASRFNVSYMGHATASESDPRAAAQQVLGQGAQAVVVAAQPAAAARIAQAVQQSAGGSKPLILGLHGLSGYEFPYLAGDAAVNAVFANTTEVHLTDVPDSSWPSAYRSFVQNVTRQYGYAANGVDINGSAPAADCMLQWAKAATKAGTFGGPEVVHAWESLDLDPSETVLGIHERPTASDHDAAGQGVALYTWAKEGSRYRLRQLPAPPAA
jgi:branched-chain amino acid transport system substrate-binding protein